VVDATFTGTGLTAFCRLEQLGLEAVGRRLDPDRAVLACRVSEPDEWCRRLRVSGRREGYAHASSGARGVRVAPHDTGGHGPSLPLHRLWSCVAPGHQQGRAAAGQAVAAWPEVGVGRDRVSTPECRPDRRGPGGVVEHRQRRGLGRRAAGTHRRPCPRAASPGVSGQSPPTVSLTVPCNAAQQRLAMSARQARQPMQENSLALSADAPDDRRRARLVSRC